LPVETSFVSAIRSSPVKVTLYIFYMGTSVLMRKSVRGKNELYKLSKKQTTEK